MSCQQELEKIQWDKENFLIENEKRWKELENQKKSGLILDVVRKEKAVAYSFNCWDLYREELKILRKLIQVTTEAINIISIHLRWYKLLLFQNKYFYVGVYIFWFSWYRMTNCLIWFMKNTIRWWLKWLGLPSQPIFYANFSFLLHRSSISEYLFDYSHLAPTAKDYNSIGLKSEIRNNYIFLPDNWIFIQSITIQLYWWHKKGKTPIWICRSAMYHNFVYWMKPDTM